tara:strand:+ start:394 stop:861 length:468 start_codon:yes stop_codon:yes gene_type:complete
MASTSTNKQPMLIDRVMHNVVDMNLATVGAIDVIGTNTAILLVDGTQSDGCTIEDIYAISRSTSAYTINLYMSSAFDYLRPNEGYFVGQLVTATTIAVTTHWDDAPRVLAPVPNNGDKPYNQAFYLPKGKALWAGRLDAGIVNDGPILGAQGGWY